MARCLDCEQTLPRDRCPVPGCRPNLPAAKRQSAQRPFQSFTVAMFLGQGEVSRAGPFTLLEDALAAQAAFGRDRYGRTALVYGRREGGSVEVISGEK